jgi:predicted metalloprotease with PDZ domain
MKLLAWLLVLVFLAIFSDVPSEAQRVYPGTIGLMVDASRAPERLFHATMTMPVTAGPLTLLYPKWIPGEHAPTGPIIDLTGLKFTAGGKPLQWRRDDVEMYAIHVVIPAGVTELEVALDYTSPVEALKGFTASTTATSQLAVLCWNWVLLYPQGYAAEQIEYRASLRLPAGWQFGTALAVSPQQAQTRRLPGAPVADRSSDTIQFQPVSLYTLVDSPVIAGHFFRTVPLTPAGARPSAVMHIASDSAAALEMPADVERQYRQLVAETVGLFGATHYRDYHFLLSLSDHVARFGLEHHESNDSRTRERSLIDPQKRLLMSALLPHEYVHSWNGKYRRPLGLTTPDYSEPMKGELLWVYEGLTDYLGEVLASRSGLVNPEQFRDRLALTAADMEYRSGRTWRPLLDTTVAAQVLYGSRGSSWTNWRRGVDFYSEGDLIWLDADATIRQLTGGKKSLDDFCKLFAGAPSLQAGQVPAVKPYGFDDIVNLLNEVAPYDWRHFWEERLLSTSAHAPLGGVEASGWKLVFDETPSELMTIGETVSKYTDLTYSLGIAVNNEDGEIDDVVFGLPAAKAGIMPGMKLVAVNSRAWTPEVLRDALTAGKSNTQPLELLVRNADYFTTYKLDYHGGNRFPHLVPNGKPDVLTDIVRRHAAEVP